MVGASKEKGSFARAKVKLLCLNEIALIATPIQSFNRRIDFAPYDIPLLVSGRSLQLTFLMRLSVKTAKAFIYNNYESRCVLPSQYIHYECDLE